MKKSLFSSLYSLVFALVLTLTSVMGWGQDCGTVTWTGTAINTQTCPNTQHFGFNAANDYAISSVVTNPKELVFRKKRSNNNSTRTMKLQVSNNATHTTWADVTTINFSSSTSCDEQTINLSSYTGERKIRFIDGSGDSRQRGINIVSLTCASSGNTVTFKANGGTGADYTQTSSTPANLTSNTFSRTGYTFTNWHTTASGTGGENYTNGQNYDFSANLDLYAQWSINQYAVTYDLNGGTGTTPTTQTANYNSSITLADGSGFSRAGYQFMGWNMASGGSGTDYAGGGSFTIPANNTTLYAKWQSTAPSLTTTGSISAMSTTYGTASATTPFNVSAGNLTGNLIITPPYGFEVSLSSGSGFGISLNLGNGNRTNTPIYVRLAATTPVGNSYNGSISLSDGIVAASVNIPNSTVLAKVVTITGLTASNKVYDGNTTASFTGSATLNGVVGSDDVSLSGSPSSTFADKNVGTNKTVTFAGYTLTGTKAGNYNLTQPTLTANITKKNITVSGIIANNKTYDTTTSATFNSSSAVFTGVINPDAVLVSSVTGAFNDANVGNGKTVNISAITLGGSDAGNYTLNPLPMGIIAHITKATPVITTSPISLNIGETYLLPGTNISSTSNAGFTYTLTGNGHATYDGSTTLTGVSAGTETLTIKQPTNANYNAGSTTVVVNVLAFTFLDGDVRPKSDGAGFSHNNAWEEYNGSTWADRVDSPQKTKPAGRIIIDKGSIDGGGSATNTYLNDIIILNGGELYLNDFAGNRNYSSWPYFIGINKKIEVKSGGRLVLKGDIKLGTNSLIVENNADFVLSNPYMLNVHPVWAGTENFMEGSRITITDWNWGTTNTTEKTMFQSTGLGISNNIAGYKFGNLIIDVDATSDWTLIGGDTNSGMKLTQNNLEIFNTGTNFITGTSSTSSGFEVGGDFIIYDGWFNFGTTFSGTAAFANNYSINGNFINASDDNLFLHYNNGGSSTSHSGIITIKGNVEIGEDVKMNNVGNKKIALETGTFENPKTIDIATAVLNTGIDVNNGYRRLKKNLSLGTNAKFLVKNGSTLDFGFDSSQNALSILRNGSAIGTSFENQAGSTLKITSPKGLCKVGSPVNYDDGNVRVTTRNYNTAAIYHYIGKTDQATGNGLPSGITGKVIVDLQTDATNENVTFTSSGTTSFGTNASGNGVLDIRRGKVLDEPGNGFRNSGASTDEESGDEESYTNKGDFSMSGGRFVVSGSGVKPSLSGVYAITGGTVEFSGTGNPLIRVKPQYYNVAVSGSNVVSGGKNLIVNNVTKVLANGKLVIPELLDETQNPYVLTSKKGIQVAALGQAIFGTNAQLMQDDGATNSGIVKVERKVAVPASAIPQFTYWSSPVVPEASASGTFFKTIFPGYTANALYYNEKNDRFYNSSGAFIQGRALAVQNPIAGGGALTAEMKGTPFNGSASFNMTMNGAGYNLVGNPYPSTISLQQLYTLNGGSINGNDENGKIDATFLLWDNTSNKDDEQYGSNYEGYSYSTYNAKGSGTGSPASNNGKKAEYGTASIGQGFMVRAIKQSDKVLTFENSIRNSGKSVFFRGEGDSTKVDAGKFWLRLTTPKDRFCTIAVTYTKGASNALDNFDSKANGNSSDMLYSWLEDEKLVIQGRSFDFTQEDTVPLGMNNFESGSYTLSVWKKEGVFDVQQNIYIKDKLLNKVVNLSEGDYSFTSDSGVFTNRLEVVYKSAIVLGTEGITKRNVIVYREGNDFIVESKGSPILEVDCYDSAGRLVKKVVDHREKVALHAQDLPSGLYLLQIKHQQGTSVKRVLK